MKWYEIIIDGGDGSSSVHRYRTIEEANEAIQIEFEAYGMEPEGPNLVDTDSPDFFDTVSDYND
jgi:hypothetical protein